MPPCSPQTGTHHKRRAASHFAQESCSIRSSCCPHDACKRLPAARTSQDEDGRHAGHRQHRCYCRVPRWRAKSSKTDSTANDYSLINCACVAFCCAANPSWVMACTQIHNAPTHVTRAIGTTLKTLRKTHSACIATRAVWTCTASKKRHVEDRPLTTCRRWLWPWRRQHSCNGTALCRADSLCRMSLSPIAEEEVRAIPIRCVGRQRSHQDRLHRIGRIPYPHAQERGQTLKRAQAFNDKSCLFPSACVAQIVDGTLFASAGALC